MSIDELLPSSWDSFVFRYLRRPVVAALAGSGSAVLAAAALVPARSWLGSTNVALLLLIVVVAAAWVGGRVTGVVAAVVASQAFNVFHTEPYGELFIEQREDIVSTVLVAVVGIAVGELTHLRVLSARRARRRDYGVQRIHRVSALVQRAANFDEVLDAVKTELSSELGLADVTYQRGPMPLGPHVELSGAIVNPAGPSPTHVGNSGVLVPVGRDAEHPGWLRLVPRAPGDFDPASLQIAVVLADLLARASGGDCETRAQVAVT